MEKPVFRDALKKVCGKFDGNTGCAGANQFIKKCKPNLDRGNIKVCGAAKGVTMKFLFITHQLSRTGAPLVLLDVIRYLHNDGHYIDVLSLMDGELRDELEEMDIHVSIEDSLLKRWEEYLSFFQSFDCVFCNTIVTFEAIHILNHTSIPTIWWIHEPREYFEKMRDVLPNFAELHDNIHVFGVGKLNRSVIKELYDVTVPVLPFGVRDTAETMVSQNLPSSLDHTSPSGAKKIRFLTVGLYSYTKGQDILAEAIAMLPAEVKDRCEFLFCGDEIASDEKYVEKVRVCRSDNPIQMLGAMPYHKLLELMSSVDFLVCPSRMDSMPTVAAEAMMLSTPVILSEACGIGTFLSGDEGITFMTEDVSALSEALTTAVHMETAAYEAMCFAARKSYEEHFSFQIFRQRLRQIFDEIIPKRRLVLVTGNYDIIDIFTIEFAKAFEEMGYEVFQFDCSKLETSIPGFLEFVSKGKVTAALTMNFYSAFMELKEGENIWKSLHIPMITYLMDHPFCFHKALSEAGENDIILCPDKNHMNYVSRFYPQIPMSGFLGHGGIEKYKEKKPISERKIQVLYAGGISRPNIEKVMPDFSQFSFDAKTIGEEAYRFLIAHPDHTTEEVLEKMLEEHQILLSEEEKKSVIADMHYVDLLAVSYFREKTIRTLVEAGIPITLYGFGWEKLPWVKESGMDFRGRVSAFDIIDLMADTKIVLSTMTWFKDGTHDRVFNGMLQGAFSITDTSKFMEEEFCGVYAGEENGLPSRWNGESEPQGHITVPEVGFFRLEEIDKLPGMVSYLLDHPDMLQTMADAGCQKAKQHTWKARAKELDRDLLNFL